MIKILFFAAGFLLSLSHTAQEYFIKGNDTVFARNMEYWTNAQGFIVELSYTDKAGKQVKKKGKKNLRDVRSLHYYDGIIERMPLNISKPDKYVRYGGRLVDGRLKVLLYDNRETTLKFQKSQIDSRLDKFAPSTSGTRLFYLSTPDGRLYDLSKKKVVKNEVMAYLNKCPDFERQNKDDFSMKEAAIVKMIRLYNEVCR